MRGRKPHGYKRKKPVYRNRFFWISIFSVILAASLVYFLFFFDFFQVKSINITGLERIPEKDIKAQIEKKLTSNLLFFKTKSIFLINSVEITTQLIKTFPQIAELKINKNFPGTINVALKERKGAIVWCQQEKCYSLDAEGVIFEENQQSNNLISIKDQKNANTFLLGEKVIEKKDLENIFKIDKNLDDQIKIQVKSFNILNDRLTVKTSDGWEIYFDIAGDVDWQLKKLGAVLEEKIPQEKRRDLEYIELRFGNLAPFRYR